MDIILVIYIIAVIIKIYLGVNIYMKKIAILFGGASSEHEVSRKSAYTVIKNFPKDEYEYIIIGITKSGKWILYSGDIENIIDGSWEKDENNKNAFISPDTSHKGIVVLNNGKYDIISIDAVLPVLHGKNGEDGTVQGLLELSDIPVAGCKMSAAVDCMDKTVTNTVLEYNGINKPIFDWFYYYDFKKTPEKFLDRAENKIKSYPMFVKPANAGSSVGVSKVNNRKELLDAIEKASKEDGKIVVEKGIIGKEVECAVLGNTDPMCSIAGEIVPDADFYDYDDKYKNNKTSFYIPARLSDEVYSELKETAIKAYKIMGCRGLSRVDFLVENNTNKIYLNEINTFPGFTSISMYPKLMGEMGIGIKDLIKKILDLSFEE